MESLTYTPIVALIKSSRSVAAIRPRLKSTAKTLILGLIVTQLAACGGNVWRGNPQQTDGTRVNPGRFEQNPGGRQTGPVTGESVPGTVGSATVGGLDPSAPISLAPEVYVGRAELAVSPERERLQLDAVMAMLDRGLSEDATTLLAEIDQTNVSRGLLFRHTVATLRIEAHTRAPSDAIARLVGVRSNPAQRAIITPELNIEYLAALAEAQYLANEPIQAAETLIERGQIIGLIQDIVPAEQSRNSYLIWNYLSIPDIVSLRRARSATRNSNVAAWIELAEIYARYDRNIGERDLAVADWRERHRPHPANSLLDRINTVNRYETAIQGASIHVDPLNRAVGQIALLLPMSSRFGNAAQAVHDGFISMHEQNSRANKPNIVLYDVGQDATHVPSFYQQAINEGADFVVGPLGRAATESLVSSGGIQVPTLLLGASQNISGLSGAVYQFGLLPEDEARMVAERAFSDGHRSALILTPNSEWGARLQLAFSENWSLLGGTVLKAVNYVPGSSNEFGDSIQRLLHIDKSRSRYARIRETLGENVVFQTRRRQDADVVLLAARPDDGRLLKPQINFHRGQDLAVYATSHIYTGRANALSDADLDGIVFPDMPWIVSPNEQIQNLRQRLVRARSYSESSAARLFAFGMDAYGLITILNQLASNPNARFEGVTAMLGVGQNNNVIRNPVWNQFRNGVVQQTASNRPQN